MHGGDGNILGLELISNNGRDHIAAMAAATPPTVRVGVGVFVLASASEQQDNPCFLVGKRLGAHGEGTYALPGGHLEFGESPEACAVREVLEETGLAITQPRFLTATNDYMPDVGKHYVTLFMVCERQNAGDQVQVLEPNKCEGWDWISWGQLLDWIKLEEAAVQGQILDRRVFLPLLDLIRQRPHSIPTN